MSSYCTLADVYEWIPRGIIANPARLISSVSASTEVLTLDGHGLDTDTEVLVRAEAGGSLPGGLSAGVTYYAINLTDSTFSLSATAGGAAINLTSAGSNVLLIAPLPWDAWIESASAEFESTIPANHIPLAVDDAGAYPRIAVSYTAGLVAQRALTQCGVGAPPGFTERMAQVREDLALWRKNGIPIRSTAQTSSNLAISGGSITADPRGWAGRGDEVIP